MILLAPSFFSSPAFAWYSSVYQYRTNYTITGGVANTYGYEIVVDPTALTDFDCGGEIWVTSANATIPFGRVQNATGSEDCSDAVPLRYFLVLPSTGTYDISLYYANNTTVTDAANMTAAALLSGTLRFGTSYPGTSLPASFSQNGAGGCSLSVSGGVMNQTCDGGDANEHIEVYSGNGQTLGSFKIFSRMMYYANSDSGKVSYHVFGATNSLHTNWWDDDYTLVQAIDTSGTDFVRYSTQNSGCYTQTDVSGDWATKTWQFYEIWYSSGSHVTEVKDGVVRLNESSAAKLPNAILFSYQQTGTALSYPAGAYWTAWDWILVGNYSLATYSAGSEESPPGAADSISVVLNEPADAAHLGKDILYNCTATVTGASLIYNLSLWTEESGWSLKHSNTSAVSSGVKYSIAESHNYDGYYGWFCSACNSTACVYTASNRTIEVGNDPIVTLVSPANDTYYITNITVNFTVTDDIAAQSDCYRIIDGGTPVSLGLISNNTYNYTFVILGDGPHDVNISCQDAYHSGSDREYFTLVSIPYFENINVSPASPQTYGVSEIWFNATVNDTGDNLETVLLEINFSGTMQNYSMSNDTSTNFYYNWSIQPAAGYYEYRLIVNDTAGYTNNTTATAYTINKADSELVLSSSAGWSLLENDYTTLSCSAVAPLVVELTVNSMVVSNPYTLQVSQGTYTVGCTIDDATNYTPGSDTNVLIVNPLISCTQASIRAFEKNITTTTNTTTLNFSALVTARYVRANLGDVSVIGVSNTWVNFTDGYYVVVNNTGTYNFTVRFGNLLANDSYTETTLDGDIDNMTGYTQVYPAILYNILDELTGEYLFPPNTTLTSIIHCSQGENYIPIDDNITSFLLASRYYLDKASLRVTYSPDVYYSRQFYPSERDFLILNFYVVDAYENALDRIDFFMRDPAYYLAKLQVYKEVNYTAIIITEGYFDASHYFSVYLMEDSDYYLRTVNGDGSITQFGRITIVKPETRELGLVILNLNPQAVYIADQILMNAVFNADRTKIQVTYSDALNGTNSLNLVIYFQNDSILVNDTWYNSSYVSAEYDVPTANQNETFVAIFTVDHDTLGNSPVVYQMGIAGVFALALGIGVMWYPLFSLAVLLLVSGLGTRINIIGGVFFTGIFFLLFIGIGWLPDYWTLFALVLILGVFAVAEYLMRGD